jgi:hypothetical protein
VRPFHRPTERPLGRPSRTEKPVPLRIEKVCPFRIEKVGTRGVRCRAALLQRLEPMMQETLSARRSSDVIGEELCAERLLKPSCLGFGFEGLDFVANALVSPAACPFGLRRHWPANIWEAAEQQAELCGGEAFTAVFIVFL